jgi:hypothetical protein
VRQRLEQAARLALRIVAALGVVQSRLQHFSARIDESPREVNDVESRTIRWIHTCACRWTGSAILFTETGCCCPWTFDSSLFPPEHATKSETRNITRNTKNLRSIKTLRSKLDIYRSPARKPGRFSAARRFSTISQSLAR